MGEFTSFLPTGRPRNIGCPRGGCPGGAGERTRRRRQGARRGKPGQLPQLPQLPPRGDARGHSLTEEHGSTEAPFNREPGSVQPNALPGRRLPRRACRRARRSTSPAARKKLPSTTRLRIESLPATMVVDLSRTAMSKRGARYRTQPPVLTAARSGLPTGPRSRSWGRSQVGIRVPSAHQPAAALRPEDVGQRGRRP